MKYNFKKLEKKWQKKWAEKKVFETKKDSNKKFYCLEMFPYASGEGLHIGHALNYTIGDIYARFKRMSGFNVFHPMGYDSFGLPAENAAIKVGKHPKKYTEDAIKNFIKQQKALGWGYDWEKMLSTHWPEYYKWTQFFFLKFLEKGLAYRKKSAANWCPKCRTVLANEQVHNGKCWRHEDTEVEIKHLEQWFLKITDYADELLEGIDDLQWPQKIKTMQKNWIGKSYGTEIDFEVENSGDKISNVVIVHGAAFYDKEKLAQGLPPQNERSWIPWLKKELEKKGINCFTPLMPKNWKPNYEEWKKEFERISVDEDSVLIGHSAGGTFLIRWLGETKKKIKKLILVAPAKICPDFYETYFKKFYNFKINKNVKDNVGDIVIFLSNDSEDIVESAKIYQKEFGAKLIELKGRGHFIEKHMKTKEFPELLEEIDFEIERNVEKVILVDAINAFVIKGGGIFKEMHNLLEEFSNRKIILTNANDEEVEKFDLNNMPYEIFTLKHNPEKTNPKYYKTLLKQLNLSAEDVIYFEHNKDAVKSAESVGIKTFHYDKDKRDLVSLRKFIEENCIEKFPIFTTRPDTIYGVTFMVISAQHENLMKLVTNKQKKEVEKFLHRSVYPKISGAKKIKSVSEKDQFDLEKEGVFTGSYAINPLTKEKIPVYAGNFVVAEYGSGMVMGVPAHDQRDFEFAKKYCLEIRQVIEPEEVKNPFGVEAFIETKKGTFLFQGRDGNTKISPNKIGLFGGGVKKGESSLEAIKRELKEELNLILKDSQIEFIGAVPSPHRKGKFHNLFYVKNISKDNLVLNEGEFIFEFKLNDFLKHKNASSFARRAVTFFMNKLDKAYTGEGVLIHSDKFNRLDNEKAKQEITKYLTKKKLGRKSVQYKLRDWLISRQRYWGTPIPVVYCDKCGIVAVGEKDLPVILPEKVKFGKGNPLETNEKFVNVKCPRCKGKARRETDTMDTFVDSSWYFMRYPDNKNNKEPFDKEKEKYWLPVDQYVGGAEHACMHLLYSRFFTKVLRDMGFVDFDEPFTKLFNQGMLHASDGRKMSKSLGNVINPSDVVQTKGADALRLTLMSFASPDSDTGWDDKVLIGSLKFLTKVYEKFDKIKICTQGCTPNNIQKNIVTKGSKSSSRIESKLNKTIKEVTNQIENFKYNLAVIKIRDLFDALGKEESKDVLEKSLKLLHPFCPHITEEIWSKLGNKSFISLETWPVADESKIDEKFEKQEQSVNKLKSDIEQIKKLIKHHPIGMTSEDRGLRCIPKDFRKKSLQGAKKNPKVYVYVLPNELELYSEIKDIKIFAVNDKKKYDPENKSKKVKPGRPGIYLE